MIHFDHWLWLCRNRERERSEQMSDKSRIEWTDSTWNPIRGCTKISPGCKNCYASTFAERFRGVPGHPYEQGFDLRVVPQKLIEPLKWTKPRMVFVNSMSDLFHERVPDDYVHAVVDVMMTANWHTYQVLTKRSERMRDMLRGSLQKAATQDHIWWGVSVEDRRFGLPRIQHLHEACPKTPFLSIEPLLEDLGKIRLRNIKWVIVGGESGAGARPMRREWVVNIRRQCLAAKIHFFFKQWGGVRKSETGRELDGRTYDEIPFQNQVLPLPDQSAIDAAIHRINSSCEAVRENAAALSANTEPFADFVEVRHGAFDRQLPRIAQLPPNVSADRRDRVSKV
jgi:protein gp37